MVWRKWAWLLGGEVERLGLVALAWMLGREGRREAACGWGVDDGSGLGGALGSWKSWISCGRTMWVFDSGWMVEWAMGVGLAKREARD